MDDSLEDIVSYIETENLKRIRKSNYVYDEEVLFYAIKSNHTKIVKYMLKDITTIKNIALVDEATMKGNLDVLKILKEKNCPFDEYTFTLAVQREDISIIEWFYKHGCSYDSLSLMKAIESGNIRIIKFLEEIRVQYRIDIIEYIYKFRRSLVVNWFKTNSKIFTPMAYIYGVETHNTELLEWLFNLGCKWDETVLERAYEVGNYITICWVREKLFDMNSTISIESDLKTLHIQEVDCYSLQE